jgi:hypothetical protein
MVSTLPCVCVFLPNFLLNETQATHHTTLSARNEADSRCEKL